MTYLTDADIKDLDTRAQPTAKIKAALIVMLVLALLMWATLLLMFAVPIIGVILLLQGVGNVSILIPLWIAIVILHVAVRWIGPWIEERWLDSYRWATASLLRARARQAAASDAESQ